jgi:hypothetical protein
MKSGLAGPLYSWACRLSASSGKFFPSIESIANYLGSHRSTVFKALQEHVETGWFEVERNDPGYPVIYRPVDHDEWADENPGCCIEKDVMPWEGEGDPLGIKLYAQSGGRARFLPRQMDGLRKFGLSDGDIHQEFACFLYENPDIDLKRVYFPFRTHLLHVLKKRKEIRVMTSSVKATPRSRTSDGYQ